MSDRRKAGFTLVELMIVAIIVAILAAVAIPLMSGNKKRAVATEGQAGCSSIWTACRVYYAEHSAWPTNGTPVTTLPGISVGDLKGSYFNETTYTYAYAAPTITIDSGAAARGPVVGGNVTLAIDTGTGTTTWGGSLYQ
jgi:prepilin-type N-terminal cleavage/methylation domain-containing protein